MVSLPIVLLIFISSNHPNGNGNDPIYVDTNTNAWKSLQPPESVQPLVNDLTAAIVPFPPENAKKVIAEVAAREEKTVREQAPVPLYSLVKNGCEKGYVMDQNGVCQKAIVLRSEKKFDSERRRKRFVNDDDDGKLMNRRNGKAFSHRKLVEKLREGKKSGYN